MTKPKRKPMPGDPVVSLPQYVVQQPQYVVQQPQYVESRSSRARNDRYDRDDRYDREDEDFIETRPPPGATAEQAAEHREKQKEKKEAAIAEHMQRVGRDQMKHARAEYVRVGGRGALPREEMYGRGGWEEITAADLFLSLAGLAALAAVAYALWKRLVPPPAAPESTEVPTTFVGGVVDAVGSGLSAIYWVLISLGVLLLLAALLFVGYRYLLSPGASERLFEGGATETEKVANGGWQGAAAHLVDRAKSGWQGVPVLDRLRMLPHLLRLRTELTPEEKTRTMQALQRLTPVVNFPARDTSAPAGVGFVETLRADFGAVRAWVGRTRERAKPRRGTRWD
jgi:hypothetical protein